MVGAKALRAEVIRFEGEVNVSAAASRRMPTGFLWGAISVLAWAAFIILTTGSSAHADETPDDPLDSLTGLVSSTLDSGTDLVSDVVTETVTPVVEAVTPVVTETVSTVTEPVAQTIESVESVPVVGDIASDVAQPVTDTAADLVPAVATPVAETLQNSPVASLTDPALEIVSDVPLVGQLLRDLGVTDAVSDVVDTVDATTGLIGNTIDAVVPPVLEVIGFDSPALPDDMTSPANPPASAQLLDTVAVNAPAAGAHARISTVGSHQSGDSRPADISVDAAAHPAGAPDDPGHHPAHAPPGAPGPSSSASHGGSPTADAARFGDESADSFRAVKRALAVADDDLPSSAVADTDTSPD